MLNSLVSNILTAIIVALIGIIASELIPFLKESTAEATARLRQTHWEWAADIIDAVVRAVEQTLSDELHGEEKRKAAFQKAWTILGERGIDLDYDQINLMIEAAVQAMNEGSIKIETPVIEPVEEAEEDENEQAD